MSLKSLLIILLALFLFGGCATYNVNKHFTQYEKRLTFSNEGYVVFSDFDIPQPATRSFKVSNGIGLGDSVELFDVTDDIQYIGKMIIRPPVGRIGETFLETHLPVGKRILMLALDSQFWGMPLEKKYTDFIEVNVTNDNITHISISYYLYKKTLLNNWTTAPKFTQLLINNEAFEHCSNLQGDKDIRLASIDDYMKQTSINETQKFFKDYCLMLSSDRRNIMTPNQDGYKAFQNEKEQITKLKNNEFPKWQSSKNKNRVFPLIQPEWVFQKK